MPDKLLSRERYGEASAQGVRQLAAQVQSRAPAAVAQAALPAPQPKSQPKS